MSESRAKYKPIPLRILGRIWGAVTWLRTFIFNVLFLILFLVIIAAVMSPKDKPLPGSAPLLVSPEGLLVDQYTYIAPADLLLNPQSGVRQETLVMELIETIHTAANDPRISGLLLHLDRLGGGGISKMQEVGNAINRFKKSGKPVIAFADSYTQQQYFLASYADQIYLHEMGNIQLTGFGVYQNYLKEAMDKIAIDFHVFRVGTYKDFVEPFTQTGMSDASREHHIRWLEELWQSYTLQIERQRGMEPDTLNEFINDMPARLAAVDGNFAEYAVENQLVDAAMSRTARNATFIEQFGEAEFNRDTVFNYIDAPEYYRRVVQKQPPARGNVGVIVAAGTILDGSQPEGNIGGDSMAQLIRKARKDKDIKALVVRVDSGGGSAFASEVIRNELQATRATGMPVVISMGSVAASGGYWLAMAADEVWATPTTITGSIGVFGILPTFDKALAKLGIHSDGVGTTEFADAMRLDRPLSPKMAEVIQQSVEMIYQRFLTIVAESRDATTDEINKVAEGRVWTGARAKELGLVDHLGYLEDAVQAAAEKAGLAQAEIKMIERDLTPHEMLMRELMNNTTVAKLLEPGANHLRPELFTLIKGIWQTQEPLFSGDARNDVFAICLYCTAP